MTQRKRRPIVTLLVLSAVLLTTATTSANPRLDALRARADAAEQAIADLTADVEAALAKLADLEDTVALLRRDGNDIYLEGANLWINNGTGSTNGSPNALGNLVIGYNEQRPFPPDNSRGGSHYLVLGLGNNFTTHQGIVAGQQSDVTGFIGSVLGGYGNWSSGDLSTVAGLTSTAARTT